MDIRLCNVCERDYFDEQKNISDTLYNEWLDFRGTTGSTLGQTTAIAKPCDICLGILKKSSIFLLFNKILENISSIKHTYETFSLFVSLPRCILFRQKCKDLGKNNKPLSVKEMLKSIIASFIEKELNKQFSKDGLFVIELTYTYLNDLQEVNSFISTCNNVILNPILPRKRKTQTMVSSKELILALENIDTLKLKNCMTLLGNDNSVCLEASLESLTFYSQSIFLGGRYNKYSRMVSQTPWLVESDSCKLTGMSYCQKNTSVQEILVKYLQPVFQFTDVKFVSSGREDIDVRMLGKGRPFALELINPVITHIEQLQIDQIQSLINNNCKDIQVNRLQIIKQRKILDQLYRNSSNILKNYTAVIIFESVPSNDIVDSINHTSELVINQYTPLRVLHRRVACCRQRTIYSMTMTPTKNKHIYLLSLKTQSGTYIKEFVHGDMGRTQPCLSSITNINCDILALDVNDVEMDWPPPSLIND